MESQNATILKWFKNGGSLTSLEAFSLCGSTRLAARIKDLREAGNNIKDMWVKSNGKRFKRYSLGSIK